ncbi:MAG TPA: hypothetical protein VFB54_15145 [Burkholderiales bacterium]|nr:hypothetical protein [Burkholderiales bacterium]
MASSCDLRRLLPDPLGRGEGARSADGNLRSRTVPRPRTIELLVRSGLVLVSSMLQYGLESQRLLPRHLPRLIRAAEAYRKADQADAYAASEWLDALRQYVNDMAAVSADQFRRLDQDLRALLDASVPAHAENAPVAAPSMHEAQPATPDSLAERSRHASRRYEMKP